MKARLIIARACSRDCVYCCNKYLTVEPIKVTLKQYVKYILPVASETIITGGEPQEVPAETLSEIVIALRKASTKPIYVYTQICNTSTESFLSLFDGVTYTLHHPFTQTDADMFDALQRTRLLNRCQMPMHLTINKDAVISLLSHGVELQSHLWTKIRITEFIKGAECPLPKEEVLFELAN